MIGRLAEAQPPFQQAYRIIPTRYPPVGLFDDLVAKDDLAVLYEIEGRTNDRLRRELGELDLVDPDDWLVGAGSTPIMAAFTHPSPSGSRFSDGGFGVYYCADAPAVAIRETAHHRAIFLRQTGEGQTMFDMRQYVGTLAKPLYDGRGGRLPQGALDPDSYSVGQGVGRALRDQRAWGLVYPSVREPGGLCAALFRPPAITDVVQSVSYRYVFDGDTITEVYPVGEPIRLR